MLSRGHVIAADKLWTTPEVGERVGTSCWYFAFRRGVEIALQIFLAATTATESGETERGQSAGDRNASESEDEC